MREKYPMKRQIMQWIYLYTVVYTIHVVFSQVLLNFNNEDVFVFT